MTACLHGPTPAGYPPPMPAAPVLAVACNPPDEETYRQLWPLFGRGGRIVLWVLLILLAVQAADAALASPLLFSTRQEQILKTLFYFLYTFVAAVSLLVCYVRTVNGLTRAARQDTAAQGGGKRTFFFYADHVELRAGKTCLIGLYADVTQVVQTAHAIVMIFRDGRFMLLCGEDMTPQQGQAVRQYLIYVLGSRYRAKKELLCTARYPAVLPPSEQPSAAVPAAYAAGTSGAFKSGLLAALGVLFILLLQMVYTALSTAVTAAPDRLTLVLMRPVLLMYGIYAVVFAVIGGIVAACVTDSRHKNRQNRRRQLIGTPYIRFDLTKTHLLVSDEHGRTAFLLKDVRLTRRGRRFILCCGGKKWRIDTGQIVDPVLFWQRINEFC